MDGVKENEYRAKEALGDGNLRVGGRDRERGIEREREGEKERENRWKRDGREIRVDMEGGRE